VQKKLKFVDLVFQILGTLGTINYPMALMILVLIPAGFAFSGTMQLTA
jgi:hypothetical protein